LREISSNTSMLDVLDFYDIEYHNAGPDRYKCLCPFHNDHNPSLVIYTTKDHKSESFCCYVDNKAGDSFLFIRLMEDDDFNQAWSVLCHINKIEDTSAGKIDKLDMLFKSTSTGSDTRSISNINFQISIMYRDLFKECLGNLELAKAIDIQLKQLDEFFVTNPSYVQAHQYFKYEIDRLKALRTQFKNS